MEPLEPADAVPVTPLISPVEPANVASAVDRETLPDPELELSPLLITALPPRTALPAKPADTRMSPPRPEEPLPTVTLKVPPLPPTASPLNSDTQPLLPEELPPLPIATVPEAPLEDTSAVVIRTLPEPDDALAPDSIVIEPPTPEPSAAPALTVTAPPLAELDNVVPARTTTSLPCPDSDEPAKIDTCPPRPPIADPLPTTT